MEKKKFLRIENDFFLFESKVLMMDRKIFCYAIAEEKNSLVKRKCFFGFKSGELVFTGVWP